MVVTVDYVDPATMFIHIQKIQTLKTYIMLVKLKSITIPELKKAVSEIIRRRIRKIQKMPGIAIRNRLG